MKQIKLGGRAVTIYDTIEDLPITRFHKFSKLCLIDANIGSDLADYDRHLERVTAYIQQGEKDKAVAEIDNMRQTLYMIQSEMSPSHMAFAALVAEIDGVQYNDMSDEGIRKIVEELGQTPRQEFASLSDDVKKKIDDELRAYFPALFDDAVVKEYYDKLIRRTKLILNTIINGDTSGEVRAQLKNITNELITYFNPKPFNEGNNTEITYDKQFNSMCMMITKNLHTDAKKFTVMEFYNAYEYVKEQAKQIRESLKR